MAHWQATDGTRASVLALSQLANILRRAIRDNHPFPPSMRQMDWDTAAALQLTAAMSCCGCRVEYIGAVEYA